ncbi:MAG TPA: dienelactone hydrolase family protein [Xanthobacteraceae bacterium]|nr:dienelactone hydrolase family protein [Xanthobacteraceae bacterium]
MKARGTWLVIAMAMLSSSASGQTFKREELRVPAPGAGRQGLQVILVKPDLPGRLPLAVITHGSPRKPEHRRTSSPLLYLPAAIEFARRGWAAAIVMRRGYGNSGGEYAESTGSCVSPDHTRSVAAAGSDLRASVAYLRKRSDIDGSRLIAIGQSTGGLMTIGLTANPPSGLVAAINFAGGQIPARAGEPCKGVEHRLVDAFKTFGKKSRVPTLWIYSDNDKIFPPEIVEQLKNAFSGGGGQVEYIKIPPFRDDGHSFFARGVLQWTPHVDQFLKRSGLALSENPLPVPQPIDTPTNLSENGRKQFEEFFVTPPNRALAISPTRGALGWHAGAGSLEHAKKAALAGCAKHASDCRIVVVNDEAVP